MSSTQVVAPPEEIVVRLRLARAPVLGTAVGVNAEAVSLDPE